MELKDRCEKCQIEIKSEKVVNFSKKMFNGHVFCFKCQKETNSTEIASNITDEKVPQETKGSGDYWKDKDNKISRHGALNTAVQVLNASKEQSGDNPAYILQEAKKMAEDIIKWVNQE